ncbi:bacterioferritin [Taylorella equigenitalis]|uniref:Bacterioferritin n=2 Tax=Taylorella equigenitalis TaxID=29575 RepID=A0A654KGL7_TAYEM|nr:bacterioferritin [Taylorella equigenitalis]ADU91593.1 Bacterioferritin [Taylorella equigenitalis MCE9]AFN35133.1 bacterioferritin [Taylorella equigenitalis ATCC 35865]ASY29830.1 bacterioferritin [Taylorella equigenitalis]ASY37133.1 bacterioferritin [Taylorella equigenitalis]ASY38577.1 bacterioferritin [Taylorella equigenitalis]
MKAPTDANKKLNSVLKHQLTAINQYFLHARMLKNWGYKNLGKKDYHESIDHMKMADSVIERIFLLEGLPNLQDLGKLRIGESIPEIIQCNLDLEYDLRVALVAGVEHLESVEDYVSRALLVDILEENEEQIDWLETQLDLIKSTGLENYLQSSVEEVE